MLLQFVIGAAMSVACPPAKGVFWGVGIKSATVCYDRRPRRVLAITIIA